MSPIFGLLFQAYMDECRKQSTIQARSRASTHAQNPGTRIICKAKLTYITLCMITFSKTKSVRKYFWRQSVMFCKNRWLRPVIWPFSWWLENSPGYVYSLDKVQLKMHPGLNNLCNNDLKTPNTTLHCMQVSQQDRALSGLTPSYPLSMQSPNTAFSSLDHSWKQCTISFPFAFQYGPKGLTYIWSSLC